MTLEDDKSSIPLDNFKDRRVSLIDSTGMQEATEDCQYTEVI